MRCMLALLFMSTLLPGAPSQPATIVKPVANMYSHPSRDADVVSQAIYGSRVLVLEMKSGWAKISTADSYTGWIPASSFRPGEYAVKGRIAEIESLFANLYREADVTKHEPLLTVPFEARLEVLSENTADGDRWLQIRLADGRPGWVQRGDVSLDPPHLAVAALPDYARRFLGLTYTWGGTSAFGYDCSGLVQMLYRRAGVVMPRDAQPQADWSGVVPVERSDLRPGDLLYFGGSATKITHTGMYAGNGEFINATVHERPGVRIEKLDDPFWTKLFVGARRLK